MWHSFALFLFWINLDVDKNNFIKAFKEVGNIRVNESKVMWIWNMILVSCISWLLNLSGVTDTQNSDEIQWGSW